MNLFLSYVFFELVEAKTFSEYYNIVFRRMLFPARDVLFSNKSYAAKPDYLGYLIRLVKGVKEIILRLL